MRESCWLRSVERWCRSRRGVSRVEVATMAAIANEVELELRCILLDYAVDGSCFLALFGGGGEPLKLDAWLQVGANT